VKALQHQAEWRKRLGGDNSSLIQQALERRLTLDRKSDSKGDVVPQGPSVAPLGPSVQEPDGHGEDG